MSDSKFFIHKMQHSEAPDLQYSLNGMNLNNLLGKNIKISFTGLIQCVNCGRKIKKTFGDGYCFPCSQKLAACDLCILKPELCHFRFGTCREPEWGKTHCLIPHVVYLANTSGLKVGITREHKRFERWGDQGATEAIVIARVPVRYIAGIFEVAQKAVLKDKTDWRALIKGTKAEIDLLDEKSKLKANLSSEFTQYFAEDEESNKIHRFTYPVLKYPEKAISHDLFKIPEIEGVFEGIRGQYLFISGRAINMRKHIAFECVFESSV